MNSPVDPRSVQPRRESLLWIGMLGPPTIWLVQFEFKYALAARTTVPSRTAVIVASIVALLAVGACALMSLRHHRDAEASPLDAFARKGPRVRFMATIGLMTSALFGLLIIAQLLADVFIKAGLQ